MADKDWVPAFEGQRPPLTGPAPVHGAYRSGRLSEVAAAFEEQLAASSPAFSDADDMARKSLAWVSARIQLAHEYLDEHGLVDECGNERPIVRALVKWEGRQATLLREMGMTTLSRSELRLMQAKTATEMVSLNEVQEALGDLMRVAVRFVPRERVTEYLAAARATMDGVGRRRELESGRG